MEGPAHSLGRVTEGLKGTCEAMGGDLEDGRELSEVASGPWQV